MAGFFTADMIITSSLKEGIRRLKQSLYVIDSINEDLTADSLLKDTYGQTEKDRFRKFVERNEVNVVLDHRPPESAKYPCISVGIGQGSEEPQAKLALGDGHDTIMVNPEDLKGAKITPRVIVGPVTPESYDKMTGTIVLPDSVSLRDVYAGQFVHDTKNNKNYVIELILDEHTILITSGSDPDLNGMTISPSTSQVGNTKKSVWCRENYSITCVATDPVELIYLFQVTMLVLLRFKKDLFEIRGLDVQTFTYTQIMQSQDSQANNVWYRTINLSGRVQYEWSNEISEPIDGLKPDLKITNPNGDDLKSPEGVLAQVQKQGWSMAGDPEGE